MSDVTVALDDQHLATVEIHRPPANYFDASLIGELADAYEALDADPHCGRSCCARRGGTSAPAPTSARRGARRTSPLALPPSAEAVRERHPGRRRRAGRRGRRRPRARAVGRLPRRLAGFTLQRQLRPARLSSRLRPDRHAARARRQLRRRSTCCSPAGGCPARRRSRWASATAWSRTARSAPALSRWRTSWRAARRWRSARSGRRSGRAGGAGRERPRARGHRAGPATCDRRLPRGRDRLAGAKAPRFQGT